MQHGIVTSFLLSLVALTACTADRRPAGDQQGREPVDDTPPPTTSKPSASPGAGHVPDAQVWSGKIAETMNAGTYSYVHLEMNGTKIWVAGPETPGLGVGQTVTMRPGMLMANFTSPSLKRTFAEIYFVDRILGGTAEPAPAPVAGAGQDPVSPHTKASGDTGAVAGIAKAEGGHTVAEVLAKSSELKGKTVKVRGKVVKYNAAILGVNWLHIQDGSGEGKPADLTVTTKAEAKVGDIVVVEGTLVLDKDFGAGYRYDTIVEQAQVTVEKQ